MYHANATMILKYASWVQQLREYKAINYTLETHADRKIFIFDEGKMVVTFYLDTINAGEARVKVVEGFFDAVDFGFESTGNFQEVIELSKKILDTHKWR